MQKKSQKLQSSQEKKKKKCLKDAGDCKEEMRARFQTLSEKSGHCREEADILEEEIQALQAGEERRGSCASQSNGCCFCPAIVEQFFTMGAGQAVQQLAFIHGEIRENVGQFQPEPTAPELAAAGKEKEE